MECVHAVYDVTAFHEDVKYRAVSVLCIVRTEQCVVYWRCVAQHPGGPEILVRAGGKSLLC